MSPRSILKSQSAQPSSYLPRAGHVHFPPSPQLSSTFYAHPSCYYDRSAIVVGPNDCALPSRHCPERTYVLSDSRGGARLLTQVETSPTTQYHAEEEERGDTTPTTAYGQRPDYFTLPFPSSSSIPELTWSESEDSDGVISPLNDTEPYQGLPLMSARYDRKSMLPPSPEFSQDALSFLPHAPVPPRQSKRSPSPKNRGRKERTYSSPDSDAPLIPSSSTSRRYTSSFTLPSTANYGCLDGF